MKKMKVITILAVVSVLLSGCGKDDTAKNENVSDTAQPVIAETTITEASKVVIRDTPDAAVAAWMYAMCSQDEAERTQIWEEVGDSDSDFGTENYQIYARSLGQDINCFFNKDMWEVYYNKDVNANSDITGEYEYVIRLNPNKILDISATNNNCSVDDLCKSMNVTKEQLYYNWGHIDSTNTRNQDADKKIFSYFGTLYENQFNTLIRGQEIEEPSTSHILKIKKDDNELYSCKYVRDIDYSSSTGLCDNYIQHNETKNNNDTNIVNRLKINFKENDDAQYDVVSASPYRYAYTENDIITVPDNIYK